MMHFTRNKLNFCYHFTLAHPAIFLLKMPISFYIIYHTAHYTVLELMLAFSISTFYKNLRTPCRVCAISQIYLVQYLSRPFEQRLRLHISASLQRHSAFKLSRELPARPPTRMAVHHAL